MSDLYNEHLVQRKKGGKEAVIKGALIGATVLTGVTGLFLTVWALAIFVGLLVLDYLVIPGLDLEFEYLYVNGELDIDKIMSKQKRKRVASYGVNKMELLAPWKSHEMDYHRQDKNAKIADYSSQTENAKIYAMIYHSENGKEIVLLEPNETMIKDIERLAPRKVKHI